MNQNPLVTDALITAVTEMLMENTMKQIGSTEFRCELQRHHDEAAVNFLLANFDLDIIMQLLKKNDLSGKPPLHPQKSSIVVMDGKIVSRE